MNTEWQQIAGKENPIKWTGDLSDDCTAYWAGLLLRAEEMEENLWWWLVMDRKRSLEIATSNERCENCEDGISARREAEKAARSYLGINE